MSKLYFLGGEDVCRRDSKEINSSAFAAAGGSPEVLVIPWAKSSFGKAYAEKRSLLEYFRSLGANSISFAEYSDTFEEVSEKINSSDLLYLPGGLTTVLLDRIRSKGVDVLLQKFGGVIVGRSAGALALCKTCVLTKKMRKKENVTFPGISLVDFCIKVHYKPSKDEQLKQLSLQEKIYAIPQSSALVFEDGVLSFMGKVYLFQNGTKALAS
jgi:dipeptidase E